MKKLLLFLSFLLISFDVCGAETIVYTLDGTITGGSNGYATVSNITQDGILWEVTGNTTMNPWRIGGKNITDTDRPIYCTSSISADVSKIIVTTGTKTLSSINSITLIVSTSQNGSGTIISTETKTTGLVNASLTFSKPSDKSWINRYYKIVFNVSAGGSNQYIQFISACFYEEDAPSCTSTVTITPIPTENGSFNLSETSVCGDGEGGTITVTNIEPDEGYEIEGVICVNASFQNVGSINQITHNISGITEDCYVGVLFKKKVVPSIDVVEWNPDYIKLDIEDFDAAKVILEDQNTQADITENVATNLFFSKYFEAKGNVKLWAVYNGTHDTIPLSNVKVVVSSNGKNWGYNGTTPEATAAKTELSSYGNIKSGYICPNEEIVVYTPGNDATDASIVLCARDSNANFDSWYSKTNNTTNISGDDGLLLIRGGDTIDVIGGMNAAVAYTNTTKKSWNDGKGWWCENGQDVNGNVIELSTNRCLLIRKNTVHSGLNAVMTNTDNFYTLCTEWVGFQVAVTGDEIQESCDGFTYVGNYDYGNYYIDYTVVKPETSINASEVDGFYQVNIPQLDTLSCTNLKIIVKENETGNELEKIYKIPIMVKTNTTTSDNTYFNKKDCNECDVVVLKDITLTTADTKTNRDLKLYQGAELSVGTGTTYNINSLAFRRDNDTVSSLFMNGGTLNITENIYFDLIVTPDRWHYVSLPGSFSFDNLIFRTGKKPTLNIDYLVKHYDGQYRATNLRNGWKTVSLDSTFTTGQGFIFGLSDDYKKKEFRFTFDKSILSQELNNKTILNLHAWGNELDVAPNHKGWNLIGNPFMSYFDAEMFDKIRVDSLVESLDSYGNWTGGWELSGTSRGRSCRYAVIPSDDDEDRTAGGYKSVVLDDLKLSPFTCFFVQLGNFNENIVQGIEFKSSRRANKIVAKEYMHDEESFLRIKIDNWKTGCFISKYFTEEYEPGDDLESFYPIHQDISGYKLLYSAINDSILEKGIHITTPSGLLYLDEKTNVSEFEYIQVLYEGTWYDLMNERVEVENEFTLYGKRKNKDIITDLHNINVQDHFKYLENGNVYFRYKNCIYNIEGKLKK